MYYLGLSYTYPMDDEGTSFLEPNDKKYRRITIDEILKKSRFQFEFSEEGDVIHYLFMSDCVDGRAIDYFNLDVPRPQIKDSCVCFDNIEELVIDIQYKIKKYEYEKGINNMKGCRTEKIVEKWAYKKAEKIGSDIELRRNVAKITDPVYSTIYSAVTDFTNNMRNDHNIDISLDAAQAFDLLENFTEDELLAKNTLRDLEELEAEEDDKMEEVCELKDELIALLEACETYEQELEILFARKIIDDDFNIII